MGSDPAQAQDDQFADCDVYDQWGEWEFEVPQGVTEIEADLFGAQGGDVAGTGQLGEPGLGGGITGVTIPVTPGEELIVRVGEAGADSSGASPAPPGGFNGGGGGAAGSAHTSTGGGGASQINRGTTIIAIAGGGGGAAHGGDGGHGGETGEDGIKHGGSAGQSTPGLSGGNGGGHGLGANPGTGALDPAQDGEDGTAASGGNAGQGGRGGGSAINLPVDGGGGGGGGYHGGGGGGGGPGNGGSGGGGGSSFDSTGTGTFATGVETGDGRVAIRYDCADVGVTKEAALVGPDLVEYTVAVENFGPNDATGVVVTDPLPPQVSYESDNCGGSADENGWTWNVGDLANGNTATCVLVVRASEGGTIENTASVESDQIDRNPDNDTDDAEVYVPMADLAVQKSVSPKGAVRLGKVLTYSLVVTNNGPDAAVDVVLVDDFQQPVQVISATPSQGTCTVADPVECELGAIPASGTVTIEIKARPLKSGPVRNVAEVDSPTVDPNPANNSDRAKKRMLPARVKITKVVDRKVLEPGDVARYRIEVRSLSAVPLKVRVCDKLPKGLKYVSARGAKIRGNQACWKVKLAPRGTKSFQVKARALDATHDVRLVNKATVTGPDVARKSARARVRVKGTGVQVPIGPCPLAGRAAPRC